jgi:uncharacterized membrane protein
MHIFGDLLILRVKNRKKESTPKTSPDEITWKQDDTQRILAQLKKEGGQMLQSKITEQLEFSKAKTSKILGEMESKGVIKRYKRGRDKVVSIQREKEKTKEQVRRLKTISQMLKSCFTLSSAKP